MFVRSATLADFDHLRSFDEWNVVTRKRIDDGEMFVAGHVGMPQAYGLLDRSLLNRRTAAILFVHPDHRHTGLGGALLSHMESETTERQLWISTNLENLPMQRLLQQRGYTLAGVINHLAPIPELFFVKEVTPPPGAGG